MYIHVQIANRIHFYLAAKQIGNVKYIRRTIQKAQWWPTKRFFSHCCICRFCFLFLYEIKMTDVKFQMS